MSEIESIVKRIIADALMDIPSNASKIELTDHIKNDLAADSLDVVCIGIEIEKEFGIVINESELELIETVGDLVEMIEKSVKSK